MVRQNRDKALEGAQVDVHPWAGWMLIRSSSVPGKGRRTMVRGDNGKRGLEDITVGLQGKQLF